MKHLFSPWRMDYVSKPSSKEGDVFLDALNSDDDRESLILFRGDLSFIIMNLYPYNNGHLMVVPYRKVNSMIDLNQNELSEIIKLSQNSMDIIKKELNADGFNFGVNVGKCAGAGIDDHIHFHVVPRWNGDNNFMPAIGNTKVVVQGLFDTYDVLYPLFQKIS
ncbi:MAG: HIT family hydrolase [Candidatus Marinimicrobia bacterium]|nr:HIT family hydrolase [Candidatus Neomarinimicrobiota bacterium]